MNETPDFQTLLAAVIKRRPAQSPKRSLGRVEVPKEWLRYWRLLPEAHKAKAAGYAENGPCRFYYTSHEALALLLHYPSEFLAYMKMTGNTLP